MHKLKILFGIVLIGVVSLTLFHHEMEADLDDREHIWFTLSTFALILLFCDVVRSMTTIVNEPGKPRIHFKVPRVQFRLSTAIVIVIVAGAMLALNMMPTVYTDTFRDSQGSSYYFGWPIWAHWWNSIGSVSPSWRVTSLIVDGSISFFVVYVAARIWQRIRPSKSLSHPSPEHLS